MVLSPAQPCLDPRLARSSQPASLTDMKSSAQTVAPGCSWAPASSAGQLTWYVEAFGLTAALLSVNLMVIWCWPSCVQITSEEKKYWDLDVEGNSRTPSDPAEGQSPCRYQDCGFWKVPRSYARRLRVALLDTPERIQMAVP